jgi:hypothetical protein
MGNLLASIITEINSDNTNLSESLDVNEQIGGTLFSPDFRSFRSKLPQVIKLGHVPLPATQDLLLIPEIPEVGTLHLVFPP